MRFIKKISAAISAYAIAFLPSTVLAQSGVSPGKPGDALSGVGSALGQSGGDLPTLIGNIINIFIGILGIIFVVLVVYAGFLYLTAAGEDKKIEKAKSLLTQSVIGIIIILAAYAIANFVVTALTQAVQ